MIVNNLPSLIEVGNYSILKSFSTCTRKMTHRENLLNFIDFCPIFNLSNDTVPSWQVCPLFAVLDDAKASSYTLFVYFSMSVKSHHITSRKKRTQTKSIKTRRTLSHDELHKIGFVSAQREVTSGRHHPLHPPHQNLNNIKIIDMNISWHFIYIISCLHDFICVT